MDRSYYYFKHIVNQKIRKGTRIPLINRNPSNNQTLNKSNSPIPKNYKHNNHSIIQGINFQELKEKNFNNNEQIKLMLRTVNKFPQDFDKSFTQYSNLPTIDKITLPSQTKKSRTDSISQINTLLHKTTASSQSFLLSNDNEKPLKKLHLTPIKRLQRNQSQLINTSITVSKSENKRKQKLLSGVTIKNFFFRTRTGETVESIKNMVQNASSTRKNKQKGKAIHINISLSKLKHIYQKKNEDALITKWDFPSKTFGKISLFGVLNGIGKNGYNISRYLRNYFIDYFEKQNIETSMNKDNFYTILSEAFLNANNALKNSKQDCDFSGATCLLVFFPEDYTYTIYCANSGLSKAVAYSYTTAFPLSYEHFPSLISEKERIQKTGNIVNGDNILITPSILNKIYQNLNAKNIDITKYRNGYLNGFKLARTLGCFCWHEAGVIPEPQIVECNLKREDTKIIVIGSDGLWKYLSINKVGEIVRRYYDENNIFGACKELEETARLKWRRFSKEVDDISVIVLFLHWEKLKV